MARSVWTAAEPLTLESVFPREEPATEHAPRNRFEFRAAARDMMSRGIPTPDIAHALRLTVTGVLELLAETEPVDSLKRFKVQR